MNRKLIAALTVAAALVVVAVGGAEAPERPNWASGFSGWGEFGVSEDSRRTDLEAVTWARDISIAQDDRGRIFLLRASEGRMEVFDARGSLEESFAIPGWNPIDSMATGISGFAADRRGDLFALAAGSRLRIFSRQLLVTDVSLPMMLTGAVFTGGDLVVARLPIRFGPRPGSKGQIHPEPELLARVNSKGAVEELLFPTGLVTEEDAFGSALTQSVVVVRENDRRFWLVDRFRRYQVRRLNRSGHVLGEWSDPAVHSPVSFGGSAPADSLKEFEAGAKAQFRGLSAPMVVRGAAFAEGFLWILTGEGLAGDRQFIDIFQDAEPGPFFRIALHRSNPGVFGQLAVTADGLWLFPARVGDRPGYLADVPNLIARISLDDRKNRRDSTFEQRDEKQARPNS